MKRKFSVDIISIFTLLIVLTVSGILGVVYYQNKKVAAETAAKQFRRDAKTLMGKTDFYLNSVKSTAEIATQLFNEPNLQLDLRSPQSSYLLKTLLKYKQIAFIYFGNENGDFLQAGRIGGDVYVKRIHRVANRALTVYDYYDADLDISRSEKLDDTKYDPRIRPWYIGAKKTGGTFWTEPYIFFENGRPGITVAAPVFSKAGRLLGIAAADITLDGLSDFLKDADLTENGLAYISDGRGRLIAFSGDGKIVKEENGGLRTIIPSELGIPQITALSSLKKRTFDDQLTYKSNEKTYFATRIPFPSSFGKKWSCAILAPESDFTGQMTTMLRRILYLSAGYLVVGVLLTMLLARRISNPIELLSEDVLKIRNLDFESKIDVDSHIHEIQTMNDAIKAMKNSLKAFKLYMPAVLVKQLIASGEEIAIGGKERELTLFFSDIADFTTISETSPPRELMLRLADYFDAMTTIIEHERGTVDKFIGDAVMAFWGAPVSDVTHPLRACKAALRCQQDIEKLNADWKSKGEVPFHTRIGIHTGSAIVGNIGAKQRMNYTVLGDAVNLASRLEGVNKIYGTKIIISHATYLAVKELFACRVL
ncbi:MAG: hypothetical protein KAG97_08715, partial [Victivallales bacterium]|nr:hypothetical protein [Victivallales bacterium]